MPYTLIPMPIAIPFVVVFIAASLVVFWRLRRRGKAFLALFILGIIFLAFVSFVAIYVFTSPKTIVGNGPIEIQIVATKPSYTPETQGQFQIYINNPQNWSVPYPTSVWYRIGSLNSGNLF